MSVDIDQIMKRYGEKVEKASEAGKNVWEFWIKGCPVNPLKVKVKTGTGDPRGKYVGVANYAIKSPRQAGPYRSIHPQKTRQEALEDALAGFLMWYDPKEAQQTKYELEEDW